MRSGIMGPMIFEMNEITKKVKKMIETSCLFFITLPLANLGGLPKVVRENDIFNLFNDNLFKVFLSCKKCVNFKFTYFSVFNHKALIRFVC